MDLDDIVKALIPKSARKQLKRKAKRISWKRIIEEIIKGIMALFRSEPKATTRPLAPQQPVIHPRENKPDPLLESVLQAKTYQHKIDEMVQQSEANSMSRMRLEQMSAQVADWVQTVETLVQRTINQKEDPLIAKEREQVPKAIRRLEKQLREAKDGALREKLSRTLDNRRKQLEQLERAGNNRQIVELKIENTLAQLGIIYSQLRSGQYMMEHSGYARLSAEIEEEVHALEDYLEAVNEIQRS